MPFLVSLYSVISFLRFSSFFCVFLHFHLSTRYRNGELIQINDTDRYEGGNAENVALVIRSTDKRDIGNYTCHLSNIIGRGDSDSHIDLDVQCKYRIISHTYTHHLHTYNTHTSLFHLFTTATEIYSCSRGRGSVDSGGPGEGERGV